MLLTLETILFTWLKQAILFLKSQMAPPFSTRPFNYNIIELSYKYVQTILNDSVVVGELLSKWEVIKVTGYQIS